MMTVVVAGSEGRRRWDPAEKARIVAESLAPAAVVSEVARRHGVRSNLLHRWRLQAREGAGGGSGFLPVAVVRAQRPPGHGIIEIELDGVGRVRVDGSVEEEALRRVLRVLGR